MRLIILALVILLLAGCSAVPEEAQEDIKEATDSAKTAPDAELPDTEGYKDKNVEVKIEDHVVETKINEDVIEGELGAPFSEWCIAGQTWSESEEGAEYAAELLGVETFKGSEWCRGQATQTISNPAIGDMVINTDYYISEDQKEYWVVTDTMGQVTENHIMIN